MPGSTAPTHAYETGVRDSLQKDLSGVLAKMAYLGATPTDLRALYVLADLIGADLDDRLEVIEIGHTGWTLGYSTPPAHRRQEPV